MTRILKELSVKLYGSEHKNYKMCSFINAQEEREFRRKIINRNIIKYVSVDDSLKEFYLHFMDGNIQAVTGQEIKKMTKKIPERPISHGLIDRDKIFNLCMK